MLPLKTIVCVAAYYLMFGHAATAQSTNQTSATPTASTVVNATTPSVTQNQTCTCPDLPGNKWGVKGYKPPVCGTDGITYNWTCPLSLAIKASYKLNKPLGLRCHQSCPCEELATSPTLAKTTEIFHDCPRTLSRPPKPINVPKCTSARVFCMTDGSEVARTHIYCKMLTTPGLGIRCWGPCKECDSNSCLTSLMQNIPMHDECAL